MSNKKGSIEKDLSNKKNIAIFLSSANEFNGKRNGKTY